MKLQNSDIQIEVAPHLGAALRLFTFQGKNILRPADPLAKTPQEQSLFVMIPYCSYIKDNRFNYFLIL